MDEQRLEVAARNSVGQKGEQKDETPRGTWLSGAQKSTLCYAGPLAEKRKSEISSNWHRPKPIPWEKNSLGN